MLAGRGSGKTRPGAELVRRWSRNNPLIALMAKDVAMVRDVMIEGDSGILACTPPWERKDGNPSYDRGKLRLTWKNGARAIALSAEAGADAARGRQFYKAWAEEIATWPHVREAWDEGLGNAVRLGDSPQSVVTTTPKGEVPGVPVATARFIADLCLGPKDSSGKRLVTPDMIKPNAQGVARWHYDRAISEEGRIHRTWVVRWSTERNSLHLAPGFAEKRRQQYGASRIGRQELDAEILEKIEGALWTVENIEELRVVGVPPIRLVVVAVDPTRAESPTDECGIVVVGLGENGHAYVLDDVSIRASPHGWASAAVATFHKYRADRIVYEKNRLGKAVEELIRTVDPKVKWQEVQATDGKRTRAEPVSALYEQKRVHHVGLFQILEDEMVGWDPMQRASPNRMDALVWGVTALLLGDQKPPLIAR